MKRPAFEPHILNSLVTLPQVWQTGGGGVNIKFPLFFICSLCPLNCRFFFKLGICQYLIKDWLKFSTWSFVSSFCFWVFCSPEYRLSCWVYIYIFGTITSKNFFDVISKPKPKQNWVCVVPVWGAGPTGEAEKLSVLEGKGGVFVRVYGINQKECLTRDYAQKQRVKL